jgi:hypothetical protein
VSLIKKYGFASGPNLNPATGLIYPLYPWLENDAPSTFHFATLRDKGALENTIRRAQFATLNPNNDPALFRNADLGGLQFTVPFSPNVISLEVRIGHAHLST